MLFVTQHPYMAAAECQCRPSCTAPGHSRLRLGRALCASATHPPAPLSSGPKFPLPAGPGLEHSALRHCLNLKLPSEGAGISRIYKGFFQVICRVVSLTFLEHHAGMTPPWMGKQGLLPTLETSQPLDGAFIVPFHKAPASFGACLGTMFRL